MQNISSVSGKLLFFVRHLYSTKQVNQRQLGLLKDLIVGGNADVIAAYQEYIKSGTELTLAFSLIHLLHQQKDYDTDEGNSQGSRKNKRSGISIVIPKRNIQRLPADQERL